MSKTIVCLGRTGDLLNIFPLLYREKEKCSLMVAEEYSALLEGVKSYVEPLIFKGPHFDIGKAMTRARALDPDAVCCQVNGPTGQVLEHVYKPAGRETARTTSFQKEAWSVLGRLSEWDENYPLIFSNRSPEREEALAKKFMPDGRKYVLASLDGFSSPFPYKRLLLELLKHCGYAVVDLGQVHAERFYDLLGLYERAMCLVAIDSAPLQLARAQLTDRQFIPTIALTNDKPLLWNGSSWRPNHWFYCRYGDFPLRAVDLLESIRDLGRFRFKTWQGARVIHVWNAYAGEHCERPADWWIPMPITVGSCGRDSQMILKDEKRLPFLKDALRMGMQRAGDMDWVCITRPQVKFFPQMLPDLAKLNAGYAYRINAYPGGQSFVPVGDMFFAMRKVWKEYLPRIPDLVFGSDHYWPHVLAALFRKNGARDVTGCCYTTAQ